tara:strand:- start:8 stop:208 length:201 start_codon:yes stop_codon:yes gene_type:complete
MCFGGGSQPVQKQVQPVQSVAQPDELSPDIELASEDNLEIAKKKKAKTGTMSMQTDLNIPGSTPTV